MATNQKDQRNQENSGNKSNQTTKEEGQTTPKKTDPNNPTATTEKTERETAPKSTSGKPKDYAGTKNTTTDVQDQDIEGEGVRNEREEDLEEEHAYAGETKNTSAEKNKVTNQNNQKGGL